MTQTNDWIQREGALRLVVEDELIEYQVYSRCDRDRDNADRDVVEYSRSVLNTNLPELCQNDANIKAFQEEYLEKVLEILHTEWGDIACYKEHVVWLKEFVTRYTTTKRKMTSELQPFGCILPYEIQDIILDEQRKVFEEQIQKYVKWHITPVIEYMEHCVREISNWE